MCALPRSRMYVCLTYEEEFNPSEGEFNPSEGEFNLSVAIGYDSNTPGGEVPYKADNHMCSLATSCPHPLCCCT